MDNGFDVLEFTPYLLAQASEAASRAFQPEYRDRYGMLRTEWRVLFHLGRLGPMDASGIGRRSGIHKTKISRAVDALTAKRFVERAVSGEDRRRQVLTLTDAGRRAYDDLAARAAAFDAALMAGLPEDERAALKAALRRLGAPASGTR